MHYQFTSEFSKKIKSLCFERESLICANWLLQIADDWNSVVA